MSVILDRLDPVSLPDDELATLADWAGSNTEPARAFTGWLRSVLTDELQRRRRCEPAVEPVRADDWPGWCRPDAIEAAAAVLALGLTLPDDASAALLEFVWQLGCYVELVRRLHIDPHALDDPGEVDKKVREGYLR